jgi:cytochrome P450
MYRDPLRFLTDVSERYGDVVHMKLGRRQDFLLNHPDYIRTILTDTDKLRRLVHQPLRRLLGRGLLTSRGKTRQKQRLMLQPMFNREKIAVLAELMKPQIARWIEKWRDGEQIEMADEMTRLTMVNAGRTLLNVDLESEAVELREALLTVISSTRFSNLAGFTKYLARLPLPENQRFRRAAKRLDGFIYDMIAERQTRRTDDPDLLSVLVRLSMENRKGMNDEKVRDQILTFFVAGHETIATALTWTWYLLAQHPAVMEKLQAELDAVLGDRELTISQLEELPYARMVFAEAMRVYSPVWIIGRNAMEDFPMNGFVIPKGSYIHLSPFLMHRDARYYPEPERFDPERWQDDAVAARPKFSYFPFGAGPMRCIAESFAWTQGILIIAMLARKWRMRVAPGHRIALQPQVTLRSRYGMPMIVERRS